MWWSRVGSWPRRLPDACGPATPGYSLGHHNITAGTLGCLVRDIRRCYCKLEKDCGCSATRQERSGNYLILSNNHILADSNQAQLGELILQSGPVDGGLWRLAMLTRRLSA